MQYVARIGWMGGMALLGLLAGAAPAHAQPASATLRVTAEVVDVGALAMVPADLGEDAGSAAASVSASGSAFAVTPPRFSDVAVSVQVLGVAPSTQTAPTVQVCTRDAATRGCQPLVLGSGGRAALAAAAGGAPFLVRIPDLDGDADHTPATITLAYTAS